ncbi:DNA-directed RNA polymerases I, II, and III subunit RPABC1 [Malassezia restricta]|uniref:DNA-directed RNA polymerases I, II, and III subunit RPABC1 n=1 Tax=Malassezia restricta (strain ATCC 96810 / NBRC 103918 / CBS 7877) TaxID=425264 RepID=A0A3G2S4S9_MALR7|nr:DNA-directed RNA polymerases I, II, and III subunit RPABC1 [Malassezia restricta]AXA49764.1 DNA-directed RNA polymerases I, II, and III subunit RPABC1 [Malassezia restricta]AYO43101.1 DNA-directed RNA polymerases I, II, and III subunit RPABC1 [Malassezia restricta CBS 7877]
MNDDREVARLWRINRTIHELVADRGYEVSEEELSVDLDTFKAEVSSNGIVDRNRMNFFTQHKDKPEERLFVFYSMERNVGVKTMRQFINILEEKNITRGIIIWSDKMTSAAKKVIDAMRLQLVLEDFEEAFLLVNITHHQLVPKHEVLTPEEKTELLHRYRLKESQLPRIQQSDPVARYFGLSRGQVVKITRPSETSGRYCSYRICM